MENSGLHWEQLVSCAINFDAFSGNSVFLDNIKTSSDFLLFVDTQYMYSENDVCVYTMDNSVRVISTDCADSNQPIGGEVRDSYSHSWYERSNYGKSWVIVPKYGFGNDWHRVKKTIDNSIENINNILDKVEVSMSTKQRRTVTVQLFDNDSGLDAEHSLVASYENIITEDDDNTTIMEVIMNKGIAQKLKSHNELRSSQVDTAILESTGNEVFLRPVKLKDLTWVVK